MTQQEKINCLDKTQAYLLMCDFSDITHIFNDFHYKKDHMGGGISVCFAMYINHKLVGGSVLGKPRHEKKYKNCIDIRRMACVDSAPKNSESWFLGQIIQWITSNTCYDYVLSYSDKTVGHQGTIYKASNFKNIGETTPTKYIEWKGKTYHPRSITIDRAYSYKLRDALDEGEATLKTGLPKKIWIYEVNKKNRKKKKDIPHISVGINQLTMF
jgi:hypothetical protein